MNELDSQELTDWLAFARIEGLSQWEYTGQICASVFNAAGGKKGGGAYSPVEFTPLVKQQPQTVDVMADKLKAFASAHNAKITHT